MGTSALPFDPLLSELVPLGGWTWTRQPLTGSPLLDQGNCAGEEADQRGWENLDTGLRIVDNDAIPNFGDGCDIGAVELGATNEEGLLFADGFETGTLGAWSATAP